MVDTNQTSKNITQPRLSLQPQQDSVSFSSREKIVGKEEKKGLSTGAKWGIGLGLTALASVGIYAISKGKAKISNPEEKFKNASLEEITKLMQEKLKVNELPEYIEFKEAKTIEDAIKYSKEVLKIPYVDKKFSLDALNYVNEALTNVSNFNKGNAKLPNGLAYVDIIRPGLEDGVVSAGIKGVNPYANDFGYLFLNKKEFSHELLDEELKHFFYNAEDGSRAFIKRGATRLSPECYQLNAVMAPANGTEFLNTFATTPELTKLVDKYYNNPKELSFKDKVRLTSIYTGRCKDLYYRVFPNKLIARCECRDRDAFTTIYHELGHLQDMKKFAAENPIYQDSVRFRTINDTNVDIKIEQATKDFFTNAEQEIAGEVSNYAKTSIGEFVAETYAEMIAGVHLSDDVIALYKKYNGPLPNGFK